MAQSGIEFTAVFLLQFPSAGILGPNHTACRCEAVSRSHMQTFIFQPTIEALYKCCSLVTLHTNLSLGEHLGTQDI